MENTNDIFKVGTESQPELGILTTFIPTPFSISFSWRENTVTVQLENGEDVFELANIFSKILTKNNVKHKIIK